MTPPGATTFASRAATATEAGTNGTAGARRIAAAFPRARGEGRAALIPYIVAGYPDADASFEIALVARRLGRRPAEVGLPYSDPLADGATLQRASGVALAAGATLERSLRLIERIGAARPTCRSSRWATPTRSSVAAMARPWRGVAGAGAAGLIVADLTPDEGAPFEAVARPVGLAVVYLVAPTTPPARRAAVAARSGGFLYCVSLVGVTGARTALPVTVGRLVRDVKAVSPVPVAVGFGVSRPAHVGRSPGPAPTASSSPRPSSIRWGRMDATSIDWRNWSANCGVRRDAWCVAARRLDARLPCGCRVDCWVRQPSPLTVDRKRPSDTASFGQSVHGGSDRSSPDRK